MASKEEMIERNQVNRHGEVVPSNYEQEREAREDYAKEEGDKIAEYNENMNEGAGEGDQVESDKISRNTTVHDPNKK